MPMDKVCIFCGFSEPGLVQNIQVDGPGNWQPVCIGCQESIQEHYQDAQAVDCYLNYGEYRSLCWEASL